MEIQRLIVGGIEANCYILKSANELCVIDPGGDEKIIIQEIKKSKLSLKYIINTHYHEDHIAGNIEVKKNCGGKILIHKNEKPFINFEVDKFLEEGDKVKFGDTTLRIIHTPGHSEGSICILYGMYIFTGDTVFLNGCGRVDLLGGSEEDLEASLLRLSDLIRPGMIVLPGHGEQYLMK